VLSESYLLANGTKYTNGKAHTNEESAVCNQPQEHSNINQKKEGIEHTFKEQFNKQE